jgi:hypothetical protein
LAGTFHQRAAVSLFGRRISSPRRILFRLPAHSPPIHRFGVAVRPAHLIAAPHSLLFAGAFVADPPIWCCCSAGASHCPALSFVWPAHSPPIRLFGVISFGRRIPRRLIAPHSLSFGRRIRRRSAYLVLFRLAGAFPADLVSSFAGAYAANPPIWCCSIWLAHPLAVPPLPV